mmetsp:Transcript_136751/g.332426  ORF Transcript_136751/g.332426 Transcript_136751/m.332426 type:complete len:205 (-) Transcript_136751:105-719(-)
MRQPPDMCFVLRSMGTRRSAKPSPERIFRARGSEPSGSSSERRFAMASTRSSSGPNSSMILAWSSSRRSASSLMCAMTASTAVCSVGGASSCRWKTSMAAGSGRSRCAMAAITLLLPQPFWPSMTMISLSEKFPDFTSSWKPPIFLVKSGYSVKFIRSVASTSCSSATLKVRDTSRNRKFSVGTKPSRKMLMPSRTLKGIVTTP